MTLGREGVGVELGKEILGRKARPHLLLDARDADVADVTILHLVSSFSSRRTTSTRRFDISDVFRGVTTSGLELPRLSVTIRCCGTRARQGTWHGVGAALAEFLVDGLGTGAVGVSGHADPALGIGLQRRLDRWRRIG